MQESVILVNEQDQELGFMEKMEAHLSGRLHRAFSVFIFNSKGEMLLQKRALHKYHSAGLWTNTCCSHPRPHETVLEAAHRRLQEEMGFDCPLNLKFSFIYKAELEDNLTEHELDHVLIGNYNAEIRPNPEEVADYKYLPIAELEKELATNPQNFTVWFKIVVQKVISLQQQHL